MRRLPRWATDALLVTVGLLLALAVAVDVGRRIALGWRMRVDRHAMRVYLHPQVVDPRRMSITVQGPHDLVCATTHEHRDRHRVCVRVAHPSADGWRIVGVSGRPHRSGRAGRPLVGRPAAVRELSGRAPRRSR
jgi:hypothetical protein